jgi:hypothetical protein
MFAGKKWFLQPGLQAEEGSTVKQTNQSWDRRVFSKASFQSNCKAITH